MDFFLSVHTHQNDFLGKEKTAIACRLFEFGYPVDDGIVFHQFQDDLRSILICHTRIDPCNKVFGAVACAFGFGVTLPPNGFKIHILYAVSIFKRKSKIYFGRQRCIALVDAGADAPIFCYCRGTVSLF